MAYRAAATTTDVTYANTIAATMPATVLGDYVLAGLTCDTIPTITPPSGWTQISSADLAGGGGGGGAHAIRLFRRTGGASGSEPGTYTWNVGAGYLIGVTIISFSGRTISQTVQASAENNGHASPATCAFTGVTAATADDMAWFGASDNSNGGGTGSWGTPTSSGKTWVTRANDTADPSHFSAATVDNVSSGASGTVSAVITTDSGDCGFAGFVVTIPSSGGGGAAPPPSDVPRVLPAASRRLPRLTQSALPPMAAAAPAPPPPEAPRVVRVRVGYWAPPPHVLPPAVGVFTGTGFPDAVVPRLAQRRIAVPPLDCLPPMAAAPAPSPPPPDAPRAVPARAALFIRNGDVMPPAAAPPPLAAFPATVTSIPARRALASVPFDAPPPPATPAPPPPPSVALSLPRAARRASEQMQSLPPRLAPPEPSVFVRVARRVLYPFTPALPMLPPVVFGPPPEPHKVVRALRRIWRWIGEVGWPRTIPVVSPPLNAPLVAVFDTFELLLDVDDVELTMDADDGTLTLDVDQ